MTFKDNNGTPLVVRSEDYYPFGATSRAWSTQTLAEMKFKYQGKERDTETGYDYFEARTYDPQLGRFLQVDPLAEKYATITPFSGMGDNPIGIIDPNGMKILFANGVSPEFKKAFAQAVQHLNKNKVSGILASLEKSNTVFFIAETSKNKGTFNPKTNTITWNPSMGVITNNGTMISPTTVLNHEADHANQKDKNPEQYSKDKKTEDAKYDNAEEKRVITGSEQITANGLGETTCPQVTRTDHSGTPYETEGPTSTDPKSEIVVTPKADETSKGTKKDEN